MNRFTYHVVVEHLGCSGSANERPKMVLLNNEVGNTLLIDFMDNINTMENALEADRPNFHLFPSREAAEAFIVTNLTIGMVDDAVVVNNESIK